MNTIYKKIAFLPMLLLVTGCANDVELNHYSNDNGFYSLQVQMPGSDNPTRVDLTQIEGTKDLKATWHADDEVLIILTQEDKDFNAGKVRVSDISEDGKQATINFVMPNGINLSKPFTVYGFTGIEATVQYYEDNNWHPRCMASLLRAPIEKFKAPMFAQVEANYDQTSITTFHHFGTYELLHVKNSSNDSISFAHNGFDVDMPWYQAAAFVEPNDGNGPVRPSGEWDGENFSDSQTIAAGAEGVFISWYIPSGFPITEAHLLASINGQELSSTNTFTSEVSLERAQAYHMYATWDGESLTFDKGKQKLIKVEPTQIDFGEVPVRTSKTEQFTVSNVGTATLTFSVKEIHGEFDIPESGKEFTLAPEETKIFDVTFTPTEVDVYGDTIVEIYSDAESGEQTITLSGIGIEGGNPINDLTNGLVAYYPFNGNANDESGNGNHGTIIGNVELVADKDGNPNSAYRFTGQPLNYISVPDNEVLHCSTFTLSAWVYTDAEDYGSGYLINKGRDIINGSYRLYVRGVGASVKYGGSNDAYIDEIPETKVWHFIVGTVEGNIAKYYLDGVLKDERTLSYPFEYNNSEPLTLGMHYYSGVPSYWAYPLNGVLDEVRIYNRALSDDEVKLLAEDAYSPSEHDCPVAEAIDLGLPSGTLWASWNVGASKPEEYGGYYAWGETEEKDYYDWSTYTHCDGSEETCHYIGDNIAGTEYDVAHVKWGGSWRMPTKAQQEELINTCTWEWMQLNNVKGIKMIGPNGSSIFLPFGGYRTNDIRSLTGSFGYFWSSSNDPDEEYRAGATYIGGWGWNGYFRCFGQSVRPVCP